MKVKMSKINYKQGMSKINYKQGYLENGELKFRNEKVIEQDTLTSDCWLIQFTGLEACKNCEFKDTKQCGGGETLKKMLNERI
jgi:hypothetical protein